MSVANSYPVLSKDKVFALHRESDVIDPDEPAKVSRDDWFRLLGSDSRVEPWTFGYTDEFVNFGMDRRTIPEHVFYFATHGGFQANFDNQSVEVPEGAFIWIMPGATHETRPLGNKALSKNYYMRLKITTPKGQLFRLDEDCIVRDQAWVGLPYIKQLLDELQTPHEYHSVRVRALIQLLTSWATASPERQPSEPRSLTPQQCTRLIRYMEHNGGAGVRPDMLAELLGLSPVYFARIFRATFGVSPKVWIVQQRIHIAASLLAGTQYSLKETARRLGYSDFFMFSRQFKQVMGVSPRAYRDGIAR